MANKMHNNIAKLRKQNKLSQEELADLLGITRPYLSKIENGKVNPGGDIVVKIASIFEKPVEEIFFT